MAVHSSQTEVENLLLNMRVALQKNKFCLIDRTKNMATLAMLGLLQRDVVDELLNLSFADYISGPEIDRNFPDSDCLWIFKRSISGQLIYIKFKVETQTNGMVKVISFHLDEAV